MSLSVFRDPNISEVFICSPFESVREWSFSAMRELYSYRLSDVFTISSDSQAKLAVSYSVMVPLNYNQWFFFVDVDKLSRASVDLLVSTFHDNPNCVVYYSTKTYRTFALYKESFRGIYSQAVYSLTLSEMGIILGKWADPKRGGLSRKLLTAFHKDYRRDPDSVFALVQHCEEGIEFKSQSDFQKLLGTPSEGAVTTLLTIFKYSQYVKKSSRTRFRAQAVREFKALVSAQSPWYAFSRVYMALWDIMEMKHMYIESEVYDYLEKGQMDAYEVLREKRARKTYLSPKAKYYAQSDKYYLMLLYRFKDVPLSHMIFALTQLNLHQRWVSEQDALQWLFSVLDAVKAPYEVGV